MSSNDTVAAWVEQMRPQLEQARRGALDLERSAAEFIKSRPVAALGISIGLGVLLGWLIKRR